MTLRSLRVLRVSFCFLATVTPPLAAQSALRGVVRQDTTGRPLRGVEVFVQGTLVKSETDNAGRFLIGGLAPGRLMALFRLVGHRPVLLNVVIPAADTASVVVTMPRAAQQLEPLVVTEAPKGPRGIGLEGFEERRRLGFGRFIDSAELRRSENRRLSDVVRQTGVRIERATTIDHREKWYAASRVRATPDGTPCYMQVVLDGVAIYRSPPPGGAVIVEPPDLSREFAVHTLEAVEVYRSAAETPIEFGGAGSSCGTIVLWTRRGDRSIAAGNAASQPGSRAASRRGGLFLSASFATMAGAGTDDFGTTSSRSGILGGAFVELGLKPWLSFATELAVVARGVHGSEPEQGSELRLRYIEVPLLFKLQLPRALGRLRPFLVAGPAISVRISCEVRIRTPGIPRPTSCSNYFLTETQDLSLLLGAGAELRPFFLAARYDLGINSLNRAAGSDPLRNRAFSVLAGYSFSLVRR